MVELKNVVLLICHLSNSRILLYQQINAEIYKLLTPSLLATTYIQSVKIVTMEDSCIIYGDTIIPILVVQRHGIVYCV